VIEGEVRHHPETVRGDQGFDCFDSTPKPGDTLLVGLSNAVPSCAVALRFDCEIEGVGVDPADPPLVWEAWDGHGWAACEVDRDDTGGLNRAGDVVLHVPPGHTASLVDRQRAGWVRCRVVAARDGQPAFSASPKINRLAAFTVGGTVDAVHAEIVEQALLGASEGVPGQRFWLERRPVVPGDDPVVLEVADADGDGWQAWTQVASFAGITAADRHFTLDPVAGEIALGPAVREADGTLRQYGAVPPKGATLRVRGYLTGGGRRGNVAAGAIQVLKSSIPYVQTGVVNRRPAAGGVDGETVEEAKVRGPLALHTRSRAVTADDFEQLAREAAPEVARVHCAAAGPDEPGVVRVLIVPAAGGDELGRLGFEQLKPSADLLQRIAGHLDERRVVSARVVVEPPHYQGLTIVASLRARPRTDPDGLRRAALAALYRYLDPVTGGPDGSGWPFGRPVHAGELYPVLQGLDGTAFVDDLRLFPAHPLTGERLDQVQRLDVPDHALVFSYEHRVRVTTP
jgi:predicted phage baseplate assembly protein